MKVVLEEVTKVYDGGVRALDDLSMEIADGELFALLGPSGCGKTTLLRTIAGLETTSSGRVRIGERDVTRLPPGARDVAMVFQDYALFPHMTVVDNIAYPLRIRRVAKAARRTQATETGENLSLSGLMARRPAQLSGGQQQRVALARAIAARPTVFLFDEPLSNLDARLRLEARTFLKKLQHELGVTTVFVTHDQAEALALADRIAVMADGKINQVGTPREVFQQPANAFVASFIGSTPMNLLPGFVRATSAVEVAGARLPIPVETGRLVTPGDKVTVGVRPEYLTLTAEPSAAEQTAGIEGNVVVIESLGTSSLVTVETATVTVQAVVPDDQEPPIAAHVWAVPQAARVLVFRADGSLVRPASPAG